MTVWKVTCHWLQENDYSYSENGPTNIGIFTSKPLAALAALDFIKSMNRRTHWYARVISEVWDDYINISEYELSDGCSYEFADIYFEEVELNCGLTY